MAYETKKNEEVKRKNLGLIMLKSCLILLHIATILSSVGGLIRPENLFRLTDRIIDHFPANNISEGIKKVDEERKLDFIDHIRPACWLQLLLAIIGLIGISTDSYWLIVVRASLEKFALVTWIMVMPRRFVATIVVHTFYILSLIAYAHVIDV